MGRAFPQIIKVKKILFVRYEGHLNFLKWHQTRHEKKKLAEIAYAFFSLSLSQDLLQCKLLDILYFRTISALFYLSLFRSYKWPEAIYNEWSDTKALQYFYLNVCRTWEAFLNGYTKQNSTTSWLQSHTLAVKGSHVTSFHYLLQGYCLWMRTLPSSVVYIGDVRAL